MALITKVQEFTQYISTMAKYSQLPPMQEAEHTQLIPILGEALYNTLNTAYNENILTPNQSILLDKCRAVIVPFALISELPLTQNKLSDNGFIAQETQGARKPFKWEYNLAQDELFKRGYEAQEHLTLYLKYHGSLFPDWASSPYNDDNGFKLIRDGADLGNVLALKQPHRCYILLKPLFTRIAEIYLKPNLGEAFYNTLNSHIQADTLTDAEKSILPRLRMATALMVMKMAAVELTMNFSDKGFTIVDGSRIKDAPNETIMAATDAQIQRFIGEMNEAQANLLSMVVGYMNKFASPTVFPDFYTSDLYRDPSAKSKKCDNRHRKGVFGV